MFLLNNSLNIIYADTRCSSLPVPTNGRPIVYAPDTTEDFDTGTTATYGCMEGFAFSGGNVVETCNIRAWYGTAPRCEGIISCTIYVYIQTKKINCNDMHVDCCN